MAVTSKRLQGTDIYNWYSLAIGPECAVTDTFVQNSGESDAYITVGQSWNDNLVLKPGQSIAFDGMSYQDISNLYVSDDGNGTTIGILAVSR